MPDRVILNGADIRRAVTRIAHEIVERNHGCDGLTLIGIHTRGVPLARRIASSINEFEKADIAVGKIDITLHRDDITPNETIPALRPTDIPPDLEQKCVVLVDDVLYTGRTIRAAMDALIDSGRPKAIQLVALVDRGHRELPIRADYVGKNLPTATHEEVRVRLKEVDGVDEVAVVKNGEGGNHHEPGK